MEQSTDHNAILDLVRSLQNDLPSKFSQLQTVVELNIKHQEQINSNLSSMMTKLFDKNEEHTKEISTLRGMLTNTWILGVFVTLLVVVIGFFVK